MITKKVEVNIILAVGLDKAGSVNYVIGNKGKLPWEESEDSEIKKFRKSDMVFFRSQTIGHAVVMGRKTWESIPENFRPLPNRHNIILTRSLPPSKQDINIIWLNDLESAIESCKGKFVKLFIIGGAELYNEAIEKNIADNIYMTYFPSKFEGDTFVDVAKFINNYNPASRTSMIDGDGCGDFSKSLTIVHYKKVK